jgi:hypothetical protein
MTRRLLIRSAAMGAAALLVPRRGPAEPLTTDAIGDRVQTLPPGRLPDFEPLRAGDVRNLYRYAMTHGDELRYVPCFCGCARFGHHSNRDCYIKSTNPDGTITFTSHAAT